MTDDGPHQPHAPGNGGGQRGGGRDDLPFRNVKGAFEPVQAVWQDDELFRPKPGKRLSRLSDTETAAELKLVVDKPTLLFGTLRHDHRRIVVSGMTTAAVEVPVKFRFTLFEGNEAEERVIWEEPTASNRILLDGGPVAPTFFSATIRTDDGLPPGYRFRVAKPGRYRIEAELLREHGEPTGLKVIVRGEAVRTRGPKTYFVPLAMSAAHRDDPHLATRAALLSDAVRVFTPEYFPLARGGLPTGARREPLDHSGYLRGKHDLALMASLLSVTISTPAELGDWERVVCVMAESDYEAVHGTESAGITPKPAFATPVKTIFVEEVVEHWTVAHELVHTLPYLWSGEAMRTDFGFDYHNLHDGSGHGAGFDVETRERFERVRELMGPNTHDTRWIGQGTYWHVLEVLRAGVPDPPIVLVRGIASRRGRRGHERYGGRFSPFYTFSSGSDLRPGARTRGRWAVVLRDAAHKVLARYPWQPVWEFADVGAARTIPFMLHLPDEKAAAEIELVAADGSVVARRAMPRRAPRVRILEPAPGTPVLVAHDRVQARWSATDPAAAEVLCAVYYSPDGGANWFDRAFESDRRELDVLLERENPQPRLRVIATNRGRSATAEVAFTLV